MIERLLLAESALARDEIDVARQLFAQVVEADPRNAIAVVGLARIAHSEGRWDDAKDLAARALAIDPDEAAAGRLLRELLLGEMALPAKTMTPPPPEAPLPPPGAPLPPPEAPPRRRDLPPDQRSSIAREARSTVNDHPSIVERIRRWLAGLGRRP